MPRQGRSVERMIDTAREAISGHIRQPTSLQRAANELLCAPELLKELEQEERRSLLRVLFPHLTEFPRGLMGTISKADENDPYLGAFFGRLVAERVFTIDTPAKAKSERRFLVWLLTRANRSHEAIRNVLSRVQLERMVTVIKTNAPDLAEKYSKILISWRATAANKRR